MKVLLTGASGFVGSHILDRLAARGIPCAVLLRQSSPRGFIESNLRHAEVRPGSVTEPDSLASALRDITHVIHCAGATKALRPADFHRVNHAGTRNLVEAVNAAKPLLVRLVHLSSLAAVGPASPGSPLVESCPPRPVSEYGRSKLAAELEVKQRCRADFTILRPPGVYGPRDSGFLALFKAVRLHLLPLASAAQELSLVHVHDLAGAALRCLEHPSASRKTYFVACPEITTARGLALKIAAQMRAWTIPVPLPGAVLWSACVFQGACARMIGRPAMLNLSKFPELCAPAWTCNPALLELDTGTRCSTTLEPGIAQTLGWYRDNGWL